MEVLIYILIATLLIVQLFVVNKTKNKTEEQQSIFDEDAKEYKVEKFYIPKDEVAKINYHEIVADLDKYKNEKDTYGHVEVETIDELTGETTTSKEYQVVCKAKDKVRINLIQINPTNDVATEIQTVINNYLIRNRGAASDYGLIKDIVERNCSNIEEEIETQTPWPLYFGLMGTMAGIIIGIGSISLTVGFSEFVQHPEEHIGNLMGDVAAAMVVSCVGIFSTTYLSHLAKNAKTILETKKNAFYSWFQAELMPIITKENASEGLKRLEKNLSDFNDSFATNVKDLNSTFALVKSTSHDQAKLLQSLETMDLKTMATANITILTQFNDTIGKLEDFKKYIDYANSSLEDIEKRNNAIKEATMSVDSNLDKVFNELRDGVEKQVNSLRESLAQSEGAMEKLVAGEEHMLKQRATKIDAFFETVQDLKPVINGLNDFKKELQHQTAEMRRLVFSIEHMPVPSGNGGTVVPQSKGPNKIMMICGGAIGLLVIIFMAITMCFTISLSNTLEEIRSIQSINVSSSIEDSESPSTESDNPQTALPPAANNAQQAVPSTSNAPSNAAEISSSNSSN